MGSVNEQIVDNKFESVSAHTERGAIRQKNRVQK